MILTSLDLELNQPTGSIIQVGWCIGNTLDGSILERRQIIINLIEAIDPFITKLTGITQEQVNSGDSLREAYRMLSADHVKHKSFMNPLTWGGGDSWELKKQLAAQFTAGEPLDDWCFGRRWIDAKTLYVSWRIANGKPIQGGLSKAMSRIELQFKGHSHRADWDAYNTFVIYCELLKRLEEGT